MGQPQRLCRGNSVTTELLRKDCQIVEGDLAIAEFELSTKAKDKFDFSAAGIKASCETSLRLLQTDHVDILYMHLDYNGMPLEEPLRALDQMLRDTNRNLRIEEVEVASGGAFDGRAVSDLKLPGRMRLKESRRVPMWNGPIECRLFRFDLVAGSVRRDAGEQT